MSAIVTLVAAVLLGAPALRLIGLALRTGQRPELAAGIFFAGAGIGVPLRVLGAARAAADPDLAWLLNATGHVFFAVGAAALYVFTRQVFRPESRAATAVCTLGVTGIAASTIAVFATDNVSNELAASVLVTNLARVTAIGWAFVESWRYFRMMRRRTALGLGDAIVTDRFRLWSLWTAALTLAPLLAATARIASRAIDGLAADELASSPYFGAGVATIRAALVLCAPIAVYGIWMSFFPPARYLESLRMRAARARP
jgi:hypothetical protein